MKHSPKKPWLLIPIAAILLRPHDRVQACGLTPPVGPNGLPAVCHGETSGWRFRAGLTLGGTDTRIQIGGHKGDLIQAASVLTLDALPLERLSLSVSGGVSLGGRFQLEGQRFDLAPGPIGGIGASYLLFGKARPFLHLSTSLSVSQATASDSQGNHSSFLSKDWRVGAAIGKTLGQVAAPFLVARYFGGGTHWSTVGKGADHYRYHVGIGCAFGVSDHVDLLTEAALFGERRVTLGVGYLF